MSLRIQCVQMLQREYINQKYESLQIVPIRLLCRTRIAIAVKIWKKKFILAHCLRTRHFNIHLRVHTLIKTVQLLFRRRRRRRHYFFFGRVIYCAIRSINKQAFAKTVTGRHTASERSINMKC